MDSLQRLADGIARIVDAIGRLASWLTLALVLLMSANVLMRYMFSIGSVAGQELEWHLMSPIVLLGMAYALMHDGHLRVDLLYLTFPERFQKFVDLASALIGVVFALLVILLSLNYIDQAWSIGEGSPDPGGLPHRFILKSFIPAGFAVLLLHSVAEALLAVLALAGAGEKSRTENC